MGCGSSIQAQGATVHPEQQLDGLQAQKAEVHEAHDHSPQVHTAHTHGAHGHATQLLDPHMDEATEKALLADLADPDINSLVDETLGSVDAGVVDKLIRLFDSSGKAQADRKVEVQQIKMDQISGVQKKLLQHSALGQLLVEGAGMALSAMPFGGVQIASLLSAVYGRTVQTVKNANNCRKLLKQIQLCDRQLATAIKAVAKKNKHSSDSRAEPLPKDLVDGLHTVGVVVQRAAVFISKYNGRGSLMAFITSSSDVATFKLLDAMLRDAMTGASFTMATVALSVEYVDESAALMKEVCEAAGLSVPPASAEAALKKLQQKDPEHLRNLVQKSAPFSTKVLQQQLDALTARMDNLEAKVDAEVQNMALELQEVKVTLAQIKQSSEDATSGPSLAPFLQSWWDNQGWRVKKQVASQVFKDKLMNWLQQNEQGAIIAYDEAMVEEGLVLNIEFTGKGAQVFLELVVMRLLIRMVMGRSHAQSCVGYRPPFDRTAFTMRTAAQVLAHDLAKQPDVQHTAPDSLPALLDVLFMGFDRTMLKDARLPAADSDVAGVPESTLVTTIQAALKVQDAIISYKVAELLDEYIHGSRQWMYDRVDAWLDAVSAPVNSTAAKPACEQEERSSEVQRKAAAARMLLLLADAGMGKSVLSAIMQTKLTVRTNKNRNLVAVHHFFKVGQARASGTVAILCLAHQLASVLDGMAAQLDAVVKEHGDASNLSMAETCYKYLVQPLLALAAADKPPMPQVLLLLDAMDEADDGGGRGWQSVASLMSREFLKLPSNVHVLVTGRPEVADKFKAWPAPETIKPESADNLADMQLVVHDRLVRRNVLAAREDLDVATHVILDKSKGQFIYIKFAFATLAMRSSWTVAQLQAPGVLPTGLAGAFQLALGTLQTALQNEKPELLLVLRKQMLPLLVVAHEPLTVSQLAWLTGAQESQLSELLDYAANLFPRRAAGADSQLRVFPYHKTVLDWLTAYVITDTATGQQHVAAYNTDQLDWMQLDEVPTAEFRVGPIEGHLQAAAACHAVAMAMPLSDPMTPHLENASRPCPNEKQLYTLWHAITHLRATKNAAQIRSLVLQLGFWEWAHAAGLGPVVLKDLIQLGRSIPTVEEAEVKDVVRWLRQCSAYLVKYPRATLQLACDSPHNSLVAKQAASIGVQPFAQLLTRDMDWDACVAACRGHERGVNSVAISSDGKTIVSGSEDSTIRVWDMDTGELKMVLQGHTSDVYSVAVSADGKTIVSGSDDKTIRVWDVESGRCIRTLEGHTSTVNSVAITTDGMTIVSGSDDNTFRVWNADTGQCTDTLTVHTDLVTCVLISADGKTIVSGSFDKTIRVWALKQHTTTVEGHTLWVDCVAISANGKTLVSRVADYTVRIWDMDTGECTRTLHAMAIAVTPDGKPIVSGSDDNNIRIWDMNTGECMRTLCGHEGVVRAIAITPDGMTIVSWSYDDNTIRVWDMETGKCQGSMQGHTRDVKDVLISANGKTIVSESFDGTIRIWDLHTMECRCTIQAGMVSELFVLAPDGPVIARITCQGYDTVRAFDLQSGVEQSVPASDMERLERLARCAASTSNNITCICNKTGEMVELVDDVERHIASVYVLPPFVAKQGTMRFNATRKRMAAFSDSRCLVYRLKL